ncbi:MAG: hypothetical protein RBT49_16235 [Bacteroidales bacterium]|jgi:hypothetical protein|nr:hypothetical protein [Bacteroidales bacterium]
MKKLFTVLLIGLGFVACKMQTSENTEKNIYQRQLAADTTDATNDFYDNAETHQLPVQTLTIEGEISNPGVVDCSKLPLRSIIVKETLLSDSSDKFVGAYRYDGYALYDILNMVKLNKKNKEEFNPIIDLYVQIENSKGEKVNLSWGEIYYPNHLQEILIATQVMRIVPSKTNDLWPLPAESKLVVSRDLITERNISSPVKITVKSYPKSFETVKGLKPLFSPTIDIYNENEKVETLTGYPKGMQIEKFNTIFYGRGRGIHSVTPFTGVLLKDILAKNTTFNQKNIREGIFVVVAKDGYRTVFTYSEIMNRNDQAEVLLVCRPETTDNGIFKLFPACDFFSDRAVKGINAIYFSANEQ